MKFPVNISKTLRNAGKSSRGEKLTALTGLMAFADFIIFEQLSPLLKNIGVPTWIALVLIIVISLVILYKVFTVFILHEEDKIQEHDKSESASLSDYYYLLDSDRQEEITEVPAFKYNNGNYTLVVEFTYGYVTKQRADITSMFFEKFYNEALKMGLEVRTINLPERFIESKECSNFINSIGNSGNDEFTKISMSIANNMLELANSYNSLYKTVVLVKTKNPFQVLQMNTFVSRVSDEFHSLECSIRGMEFLNQDKLRNFLAEYYCLDAMDLSSIKVANLDLDELMEYKDLVKIVKLNYSTGEVREVSNIDLFTGVERIR